MSDPIAINDPGEPSAKSAADDLRAAADGNAERGISSTEKKARDLKEAAAQKAAQFRDYAGEKASSLRDEAGETAQQLTAAATEQWKDTREKALELHDSLEDYVRKNPTKSILTAAGIGFLVGLIVRR